MISFKENLFYRNSRKLKVIQFWSTWCGSCIDIKHLEDFSKQNPNVEVFRLNVDENQPYALKYSIVVLPTYIFFQNSKPILTLVGQQTKESLNSAKLKLVKNSKSKLVKRKIN